ncbi:hypothetical protein DPMN_070342 [Dreissena polymorpha]|uniref:Uncharacterized protein n=1 Tax=Dreissena polymorpha TaxID=45954 RepID=A0A9D3Z5S9_DREPO|nr:hypothetical protein DPMN_070342 [Dreissena polymorpha]
MLRHSIRQIARQMVKVVGLVGEHGIPGQIHMLLISMQLEQQWIRIMLVLFNIQS